MGRVLFTVHEENFAHFEALLDTPAERDGLQRLVAVIPPWDD